MFEQIPANPDFVAVEREIAEIWKSSRVFERSVENRIGSPEFTFYEGPPTANGRPGLHHVWARVYKDLFCRFQTMRGKHVIRRGGWDTHGLPVEVQVEKALGLSDKKQIEELGIAEFVRHCRESVMVHVDEFEDLTERIGYWVDTDDAYWTLSSDYIQSVWWNLRQLWDKGLLYEDVKVVPYCPRCGTALSSHELGQPGVYREVDDQSAYVKLPIVGSDVADALLVWTTTPWTLPSNTAVAVNPGLTYAVVDGLVVADALVEEVFGPDAVVTARMLGRDLVGLTYRRPLDVIDADHLTGAWRVIPAEYVTTDDGTGLVHIAPAFGEIDRVAARENGIPLLNPVGPDGRFVEGSQWLSGSSTTDANVAVIDHLADRGLLFKAELHRHSYPHCWRCDTALIYWGKPSWYIATSTMRDKLVAANDSVEWRPQHIKQGRFGEWLKGNVDWALSRDRYWGTPLPIWRCENGHTRCIESLAELSELARRDVTAIDPHRPEIDLVTFDCPDCGTRATRMEAVIDAWFDSGSMPSAQWGFPLQQDAFTMPADFISEAIDQTRGWFYSLMAVNVLVHDEVPYRNVVCLGHIVDADGKKMSKSVGNVIDPWSILDTRGADALRWWMFSQGSPWTPTRAGAEAIDESTRGTLLTLWNTWSFFTTYARLNEYETVAAAPELDIDRWLQSRLHSTVRSVTELLESYYPYEAASEIASFIDDLSNWYVRRSRKRFWGTAADADPGDLITAHAMLQSALTVTSQLLAPFTPFLADVMWRQLTGAVDSDSVHLSDWPAFDANVVDEQLEGSMALVRRLSSLGRSARAEANVKVRQPLSRAFVVLPNGSPSMVADLLAEELNVDEVVVADSLNGLIDYEFIPNFRSLGPKLGSSVGEVRGALSALDPNAVAAALDAGKSVAVRLSTGEVELGVEDVEVRFRSVAGLSASMSGQEAVVLDVELTPELRRRGLVREVVRQVQEMRRQHGLEISDRIALTLIGLEELRDHHNDIAEAVLALSIVFDDDHPDGTPLAFDDRTAAAAMTKVST